MKYLVKTIFFCLLTMIYADFAASAQVNVTELEKQISQGLDVNARDENGDTLLLMVLANGGDMRAIKMLVDLGADVNAPSSASGMTPLVYETMVAARIRAEALQQFQHISAMQDRQTAEVALIKEVAQKLAHALKIMQYLADSGADINQETPLGTPLMQAATDDWNTDIVAWLLANGAQPDQQDLLGRTALFYANAYNSTQITLQLLSAGADVGIKDNNGKTYLEATIADWQQQ
ncbi:MAG: ankyrin repeat domain-containing protein [Alphaproteobacteria bacterium]|nr:ankyrin repeat domain-containing protein [Alphaproteobacteria bacterium]